MARPTDESIRKHHQVMRGVMAGRIDPLCRRAQDAFNIVSRYPLWEAQQGGGTPSGKRSLAPPLAPVSRAGKEALVASSEPPAFQDAGPLGAVFGSAAPTVQRAVDLAKTPTGQKAAGVAVLALGSLLAANLT